MTKRQDILAELQELSSTLPSQSIDNLYTVPDGYFADLADRIMGHIRASEAKDAQEELKMIAPLLSNVSKRPCYQVPEGYFEDLESSLMEGIRQHEDYHSAGEEIDSISPLLGSIRNKPVFTVPEGYFDKIESPASVSTAETEVAAPAKVIAISSRRWFRYAVAAVVAGAILMSGITLFTGKTSTGSVAGIEKQIGKDIKNNKISAEDVNDFLDLTEAVAAVDTKSTTSSDIPSISSNYLKDVSDDEIIDFLNELPDESNDMAILN
ncbi:MAG: hypothetical protein GC171_09800 [Terrimonas sp.]|nr:hypothetical protein [Terrimonas sp.]